jgi:hypothetical protein
MSPEQREKIIEQHAGNISELGNDDDLSFISSQMTIIIAWSAMIVFVTYMAYNHYKDFNIIWGALAIVISTMYIGKAKKKAVNKVENILIKRGIL